MADTPKQLRDKAEEKFKKIEAGKRAMADYQAEAEARKVKTQKLRALRLAKEAADDKVETKKRLPRKTKAASR